jgi:hypothetical protein
MVARVFPFSHFDWHFNFEKNSKKISFFNQSLPPSIRGKVWKLAIGNELGLTNDCYILFKNKAEERIESLNKNSIGKLVWNL